MSDSAVLRAGQWQVAYDEETESMRVFLDSAGVSGRFSLTAQVEGRPCRIRSCSEDVRGRLNLLDESACVCGYVFFRGDGDRLYLRGIQVAGQWLSGGLSLRGQLWFPRAFACRVHPQGSPHAVQFGSGLTDSLCDDGLFDAEGDCCLWFGGATSLELRTECEGRFALEAEVRMEQAGGNELVFALERNYYGSRYVPYYRGLGKGTAGHAPAALCLAGQGGGDSEKGQTLERLRSLGVDYGLVDGASGDWEHLREEADALRQGGLRPGVMADWSAGGPSVGEPSPASLEEGCRRLCGEAGYELVMLASPDGRPWGPWLEACRRGMGDGSVLWASGGRYTGVAARHAAVSGALREPAEGWAGVLRQAHLTLSQLFVHGLVFWLHTGDFRLGGRLSLEESRASSAMVALTGQAELLRGIPSGVHLGLLRQSLPTCSVHPMDLYPLFDLVPVWDLKIRRSFGAWDVVALFNWGDEEDEIDFDFAELGWAGSVRRIGYEFFTGCGVGCHLGGFGMVVPAHGVRLVAFHELLPHPQFLSSDRHVCQGGTDLQALRWLAEAGKLVGAVELTGGQDTVLTFHEPTGYLLAGAEVSPGCEWHLVSEANGILRVSLGAAVTGVGEFQLVFNVNGAEGNHGR